MAQSPDLDINKLQEAGVSIPPNYMPQDEGEAMAILSQELNSQAQQFGNEATQRMQIAATAAESLYSKHSITNSSLGYGPSGVGSVDNSDIVIKSGNVSMDEAMRAITVGAPTPTKTLITRIPKGKEFSVQGPGVTVEKDSVTGETFVYNTKGIQSGQTRQNDERVMATVLDTSTRQGAASFNLTEDMNKIKTLNATEAADQISITLAKLEVQIAREAQRVRQTAALESGYTAARVAMDRNVQLDMMSPHIKPGMVSAETHQAQQRMAAALTVANSLTNGLLLEDGKLAELNAAKVDLSKRAMQLAQRQEQSIIRKEEREANREANAEVRSAQKTAEREQRREDASDIITAPELANYRAITGNTSNDIDAKLSLIAAIKRKDTVLTKLAAVTPSNIHIALMDVDPKVREGALKLVVAFDKAGNENIDKSATTTPTAELLKKAIANPESLIQWAPLDMQESLRLKWRLAKSGKEREEMRANDFPPLIAAYVENTIQGQFEADVRKWKGIGIKDTSPLALTIKELSDSSPLSVKGAVPMGTLVDAFVSKKIQGPDGKELTINEKIGILEQSVSTSISNMDKGIMWNADSVDALKARLVSNMKIYAARQHIRSLSGIYGR